MKRLSVHGFPAWTRSRKLWQVLINLLIGAGLIWVFHDIHLKEFLQHVSNINWLWISAGVIMDIVSYIFQGWRWKFLLKPVGRVSLAHTTQAVYVGLFTNEIMPMRLGELIRGYLVSRMMEVGFMSILPSMIVERLIDGIWLSLWVGFLLYFISLPQNITIVANIIGSVIVLLTVLFVINVLLKEQESPVIAKENALTWKPARLFVTFIGKLAADLREIGLSRSFYMSFLISFGYILFQIFAFWFTMIGYHIPLSFLECTAVILIIIIGTAVPNAPSNVGSFQFFCVMGLSLFGVNKTLASGFSIVSFAVLTLPLWLLGLIALKYSGMTIASVKQEVIQLEEAEK
jgi:glycosyltransferase 2 family protein